MNHIKRAGCFSVELDFDATIQKQNKGGVLRSWRVIALMWGSDTFRPDASAFHHTVDPARKGHLDIAAGSSLLP